MRRTSTEKRKIKFLAQVAFIIVFVVTAAIVFQNHLASSRKVIEQVDDAVNIAEISPEDVGSDEDVLETRPTISEILQEQTTPEQRDAVDRILEIIEESNQSSEEQDSTAATAPAVPPPSSHDRQDARSLEVSPIVSKEPQTDVKKFRPRPIRVVTYTSHFFGDGYEGTTECKIGGQVEIPCHFTSNQASLPEADAVWFHMPSFGGFPPHKYPNQKYVAMSMESDVNYGVQKDPNVMGKMDITMTYRLDDDVPALYPSWVEYGDLLEPPLPFEEKETEALAVYIQSNCVSYRDQYVSSLMSHIKVDSYGRCLHNKEFPRDYKQGVGNWNEKLHAMRKYKFALLFENTLSDYYVTERLFHAFMVGVVPVYMGAPQVGLFAPSPKSVINVQDFETPKDLAEYLIRVANDEKLYNEHLQWKIDGHSQQFKAMMDISRYHSRCRLCVKIAHECDHTCNCGKHPEIILSNLDTGASL